MFDETPHRVRVVYEFVCSSRLSTDGSQVSVNSGFLSRRRRTDTWYRVVEVEDDGSYQVGFKSCLLQNKC